MATKIWVNTGSDNCLLPEDTKLNHCWLIIVEVLWHSPEGHQSDGLAQERRYSVANAPELHLSCTNQLKCEMLKIPIIKMCWKITTWNQSLISKKINVTESTDLFSQWLEYEVSPQAPLWRWAYHGFHVSSDQGEEYCKMETREVNNNQWWRSIFRDFITSLGDRNLIPWPPRHVAVTLEL